MSGVRLFERDTNTVRLQAARGLMIDPCFIHCCCWNWVFWRIWMNEKLLQTSLDECTGLEMINRYGVRRYETEVLRSVLSVS